MQAKNSMDVTHHLPVPHHLHCYLLRKKICWSVCLLVLHLRQRRLCDRLRRTAWKSCGLTAAVRPVQSPYCGDECYPMSRRMRRGGCWKRTWRRGAAEGDTRREDQEIKNGRSLIIDDCIPVDVVCFRQVSDACMHAFIHSFLPYTLSHRHSPIQLACRTPPSTRPPCRARRIRLPSCSRMNPNWTNSSLNPRNNPSQNHRRHGRPTQVQRLLQPRRHRELTSQVGIALSFRICKLTLLQRPAAEDAQ